MSETAGEGLQQLLQRFVVLQTAQHPAKDEHHRQGRAVLGQVEGLEAQLSRTIGAKSGQHVDDVVGLPQPVGDVILRRADRPGVNQALWCQPLGAELMGIDMTQAPLGKGQEGIQVDGPWTPVGVHQSRQLRVLQQMAKHLCREGAVLQAAAHGEHPLEGIGVFQKRRQARDQLEGLKATLQIELHADLGVEARLAQTSGSSGIKRSSATPRLAFSNSTSPARSHC